MFYFLNAQRIRHVLWISEKCIFENMMFALNIGKYLENSWENKLFENRESWLRYCIWESENRFLKNLEVFEKIDFEKCERALRKLDFFEFKLWNWKYNLEKSNLELGKCLKYHWKIYILRKSIFWIRLRKFWRNWFLKWNWNLQMNAKWMNMNLKDLILRNWENPFCILRNAVHFEVSLRV